MTNDIKTYLSSLKEKLSDNNKKHQSFLLPSFDIITTSNSKKDLLDSTKDIINDDVDKYADKKIAFISYTVFSGKNNFGVASINATVQDVNENGSISRKDVLNNSIYYTENEIIKRGIKSTDYKKLIKYLINGEIDNNPLKKYTATKLDK